MNNNLEFENTDPSPDSVEDNYPRTNYGEGYYEEPKQEAIEKASEFNFEKQVSNPYSTGTPVYTAYEKGFELGAKWQQERMYSKEEVRKISLDFFYYWWNSKGNNTEQGFDEWFEQNKKFEV